MAAVVSPRASDPPAPSRTAARTDAACAAGVDHCDRWKPARPSADDARIQERKTISSGSDELRLAKPRTGLTYLLDLRQTAKPAMATRIAKIPPTMAPAGRGADRFG